MFAHPMRGAGTLPVLFALVGFALVPSASAQTTSQDYLVLGLSVGEEKCKWSYAVCYPRPCDNTNLNVKLCGASGPEALAGPAEWTQVIADEINANVAGFTATRFQFGVDWFVRITGPDPFHFFVGPCAAPCDPPASSAMTLVDTGAVGMGVGGGATIRRVPSVSAGGPVPPAVFVALAGLLALVGLWTLRRRRSTPPLGAER